MTTQNRVIVVERETETLILGHFFGVNSGENWKSGLAVYPFELAADDLVMDRTVRKNEKHLDE